MNKDVKTWQLVLVGLGCIVLIAWIFWHFSDPTKYDYRIPSYPCETGWFVNRRFGVDEFLGKVSKEQARILAGENIIYYGINQTLYCE